METRDVKTTLAKTLKLNDELFGTQQSAGLLSAKMSMQTKYLLNKVGGQVASEFKQYEDVRNKYITENGTGEEDSKSIIAYETNPDKTFKLDANKKRIVTEVGKAYFKQVQDLLSAEVTLKIPTELTVEAISKIEAEGDFTILFEILETA